MRSAQHYCEFLADWGLGWRQARLEDTGEYVAWLCLLPVRGRIMATSSTA